MITSGREPVDLSPLISAWNNQITFPPGHLIFQMVFNVSSFVGVLNSKTNKSMTLVAVWACFRNEKGDFFLNTEGNRNILQASWQIMTKCFGGFFSPFKPVSLWELSFQLAVCENLCFLLLKNTLYLHLGCRTLVESKMRFPQITMRSTFGTVWWEHDSSLRGRTWRLPHRSLETNCFLGWQAPSTTTTTITTTTTTRTTTTTTT